MSVENILDDQNGNISVNIPISSVVNSFSKAGIITYLDFDLIGEQGVHTDLFLTAARVKGGVGWCSFRYKEKFIYFWKMVQSDFNLRKS